MIINFTEITSLTKSDFDARFDTNEKCKAYIAEKKWAVGFVCSKCENTHYWQHQDPFAKVCKNCRHIESCTSNTFFHKIKFSLPVAFQLIYEVYNTKKLETVRSLSRKFELNHKTVGLFITKINSVKPKRIKAAKAKTPSIA